MVAVEQVYMMASTIAAATKEPAQPVPIDPKAMEAILARPIAVGASPDRLLFSSQRDQIEAILSGNRIDVRDVSGKLTFEESKIPKVLVSLLELLKLETVSYGINFLITLPREKPASWIKDNVLARQIEKKTGKKLVGGAAVLRVTAQPKIWNIKLEPSEEQTIQVNFNASEQVGQLPDQKRLREELQEQLDAFLTFLTSLGL